MHYAGERPGLMFGFQDPRHVTIGVARVDDERQAGLAGGFDMDQQAGLLQGLAVGGVVIIKPAFADADHLGMAADRH